MSDLDAHVVVRRDDAFTLDARIEVAAGETVAVMGPSGAGKSTLAAGIAGHARLTAGHVRIGGRTVSGSDHGRTVRLPPNRRGVVLLGQDPRLFPHLSARENVAFAPRARGVSRAAAAAQAEELLGRVGLDGFGDTRPAALSGGQRQRVALARALAAAPEALLLDEPLTSLDPVTADGIRTVLADLCTGVTTLLITHDAVDAAALAARVIVVEGGRVTQDAAVREVFTHPASEFAASLSGLNRVVGAAARGRWRGGDPEISLVSAVPAPAPDGTALAAVFRPSAVRIAPPGAPSQDGEWSARITRLEPTLSGVRVHTASPPVAVDVTVDQVTELALAPGHPVRLAIAPDDVRLLPV